MIQPKRKSRKTGFSGWYLAGGLIFIFLLIFGPMIYRYSEAFIRSGFSFSAAGQYHNLKNFGVPVPKGYKVYGIDVSHHQGHINWEEVAAMHANDIKIDFAFIKATEGITQQDLRFDRNWRLSKKAGIVRGAYHFYHPSRDAAKQAENFIKKVKLSPGDLPPVLDIEVTNHKYKKEIVEGALEWCRIIEEHYGMKPIIYTGTKYYSTYLADDFGDYPLWIAHYDKARPGISRKFQFWQFTDKATINGVKKGVDMNVFKGDISKLKKMGSE
ncbi:MAG: glycoside hydrolase family 25 protein [Lentimicrobium sp.]|nr:glycoside hydrolase family 25 protein [Lentimicrobium sp.]